MAATAHSSVASASQHKKSLTDNRVGPETFRVNGCTPLIAESHDYYRQAHALAAFISGAYAEGVEMPANDEIMAGAFEAIEQLLAHGIYQQDMEARRVALERLD